jgi:23S rRNA (guanosine2251-2'-O)-methyltransferase
LQEGNEFRKPIQASETRDEDLSVNPFYLCAMRKLSMDELGRKTAEEVKQAEKHRFIVVLDNIRSMHNVGSVFRTADAFLAEAVFLCGYTPQPPHRDIQKTALGATESVDWIYYEKTTDAVTQLKEKGYRIYGIEQTDNSISLEKIGSETNEPIAVIFGNEVEGVDEEVLKMCDGVIEIPQFGMKHSLNISVAAGIVMWELVRLKI